MPQKPYFKNILDLNFKFDFQNYVDLKASNLCFCKIVKLDRIQKCIGFKFKL
jgi:hypothetical protein